MKIIIWFFCVLIASILQSLLRSVHFFGAIQAIILFALMWYSASFLCKAWDKKHSSQFQDNKINNHPEEHIAKICDNDKTTEDKVSNVNLSPEMKERYNIAKIMGCDINRLSSIDNLAISTVLAVDIIRKQSKDSILCHSPLACCDTILFSSFLLRVMCVGYVKNKERFITYSDIYLNNIKNYTGKVYMPLSRNFNEMFNNRMANYDRVFMSKDNSDDGISAILEEFEMILIIDKIDNVYQPIFENTPIPIISIFDQFKYRVDIKNYFDQLPLLVSPYLKQVQNFFKL